MTDEIRAGLFQRGLDRVGGLVDDAFLTLPKVLKPFRPQRKTDRDMYERELNYYFNQGYVHRPETFFSLPEDIPDYSISAEKPFLDGISQIITFKSGYEPRNPFVTERFRSFEQNRTGCLVRWTHGEPGRKTVVCLHGYMLGNPKQAERMFRVRTLYRMGLDVALFIAPFHWKRAPAERRLRGIFLQPDDVAMTCECFGQAIHDLALSLRMLKHGGAGEIGVIGASLGGYIAGLFAALTDRISFAAMMVPAVKFSGGFSPLGLNYPFTVDQAFRVKLERVWNLHSPLNYTPKIPKDRVLVIAARGDRLCPFVHVRKLCEKWDWPEHVFMTGGHWMVFDSRERGRAWYRFLGERGFIPLR